MRIAVVMPSFPEVSGTFIFNQLAGLVEAGCELDIFAGHPHGPGHKHEVISKYRLVERTHYWATPAHGYAAQMMQYLGLLARGVTRSPRAVLRSLYATNLMDAPPSRGFMRMAVSVSGFGPYDVVHCHFGPAGLLACSLRAVGLLQGPMVMSFHGNELKTNRLLCSAERYGRVFDESVIVTANSSYTANWLEHLGCCHDKIVKLPEALYVDQFAFRARTLLPGQPVRLITVGRLHEMKGIEYSIRAVAQVCKQRPEIEYRIVGDGPLRHHLSRLIAETAQQDCIRLLGWKTQEELGELYDQSHIFILTSATTSDGAKEAQGLVLCEAQAMGLPVLSTDSGGIPETVLHGRSGFLVPEQNVQAIAERLHFMLDHSHQWPEWGQAGRDHVEANFNSVRVNQQLRSLLRVAATSRMPAGMVAGI